MPLPITFQISLTPEDFDHAAQIVPHQLRQFAGAVGETLLTIDTQGRELLPEDFPRAAEFRRWLETLSETHPRLRWSIVDYSPAVMRRVSERYFGHGRMPRQTYRRGPFYSYFFGLDDCRHDLVWHVDSDMLFGGNGGAWLAEAADLLARNHEIIACNPLPGPPTEDFSLRRQTAPVWPKRPGAYAFPSFTSRLFLLDRRRLTDGPSRLKLARAPLRQRLRALIEGTSGWALPEDLITKYAESENLLRVDFPGEAGCWSLHPPFRTRAFFAILPDIIRAVETGNVPDAQRGDYDINESMVDWSEAYERLRRNRWWRRYLPFA